MFRATVLPLALLFLASIVPSNGQSTEATTTVASEEPAPEPTPDLSGLPVIYYEVRTPFEVNCTLTGKITWEVNDTALEQVPELKDRAVTEVHSSGEGASLKIIGRSTEHDFGKYTCRNDVTSLSFAVKARPHAKLALDTNVVEGQKLKMTCRVIGRPCIGVFWTFTNESAESNGTDVKAVLGDLVELQTSEEGIANATLVIPDSKRWNAGWYTCMPLADDLALARNSTTRLRVKDMYAALWPFLGICAEVLVLCAVILVYEKRRTKPELDDSDTDNHDQKKS